MSASIGQSIDAVCKEKGIDREVVIEAVKEAVRAAARKQFKSGEEIQVEWAPETGLEIFASKVVVEAVENPGRELSLDEARELAGDEVEVGDELQLPLPVEDMGRIAAQTAKQILFQKVRDAERANIYEQYIDKVGDLVNGYVKRFERGDIIVDLGTVESVLPRNQQSRGEQWNQGERVRVVIDDVSKESKGPQVVVSRTSPELLKRLFEMEVPEIYDGTVVIKSAVREPGERAKIAVASTERDVDPVGACVGMKGSRVQAIIRELRGEKIDIIEWSDEPSVFAANALSPAKVNQARIGAAQAVVESARVAAEGEADEEGTGGEESEAMAGGAAAAGGEAQASATEPGGEMGEEGQAVEQHAASVEADPTADAGEVEPSEAMIAEGYDEAARTR